MSQYKLVQSGWHDDYEFLVYFRIIDEDRKPVWSSFWYDVRDLSAFSDSLEGLKKDVADACKKYNIEVNLDSNDFWEWEDHVKETTNEKAQERV